MYNGITHESTGVESFTECVDSPCSPVSLQVTGFCWFRKQCFCARVPVPHEWLSLSCFWSGNVPDGAVATTPGAIPGVVPPVSFILIAAVTHLSWTYIHTSVVSHTTTTTKKKNDEERPQRPQQQQQQQRQQALLPTCGRGRQPKIFSSQHSRHGARFGGKRARRCAAMLERLTARSSNRLNELGLRIPAALTGRTPLVCSKTSPSVLQSLGVPVLRACEATCLSSTTPVLERFACNVCFLGEPHVAGRPELDLLTTQGGARMDCACRLSDINNIEIKLKLLTPSCAPQTCTRL